MGRNVTPHDKETVAAATEQINESTRLVNKSSGDVRIDCGLEVI